MHMYRQVIDAAASIAWTTFPSQSGFERHHHSGDRNNRILFSNVIRLYFQQHFCKTFILLLQANTRDWGWRQVYNDRKKWVTISFRALLFPRLIFKKNSK